MRSVIIRPGPLQYVGAGGERALGEPAHRPPAHVHNHDPHRARRGQSEGDLSVCPSRIGPYRHGLERQGLQADPVLVAMGHIIRDADVPPSRTRRPEAAGLNAFMRGFQLSVRDDDEKLRLTAPVYDALHAYCLEKVANHRPKPGTPRPRLRYSRRVNSHLEEDEPSTD